MCCVLRCYGDKGWNASALPFPAFLRQPQQRLFPRKPKFFRETLRGGNSGSSQGIDSKPPTPFPASFLFSSLLSTAQHHPPFFFSSFHQVTLNGLTLTPSLPGKGFGVAPTRKQFFSSSSSSSNVSAMGKFRSRGATTGMMSSKPLPPLRPPRSGTPPENVRIAPRPFPLRFF